MSSGRESTTTSQLIKCLELKWQPNEIIKVFHEEKAKIEQRGAECKKLLVETDSVLKEALALKNLYLHVSPKTSQLHSECKNIIQERNDLRESYEKINYKLSKQEELRSIFKRMPEIKNQIVLVLNTVFQDYQLRGKQENETITLDEYYGRFFVECRRIKELASQLESCLTGANTDELLIYLEEIYTLYFDIREQLIEPIFSKNLQKLIKKADRNYCDLLQQTCASLVRIIRNEIQLFNQILPTQSVSIPSTTYAATTTTTTATTATTATTTTTSAGASTTANSPQQNKDLSLAANNTTKQTIFEPPFKKQAMNDFLSLLCRTFYEHLRPVIIHINHLETLTELHKLVNETMRLEVSEECYQLALNALAEDVQERMVFRTEVFIQESVLDYKPSSGDLAYPEKLELVSGCDFKDYQSMWYPTVQRTVLTLFCLNRVFDAVTFRELAHEVVLACFKSLDIAQRLVDERHNGTKIEASLFLVKHLAVIREQLKSYGMESLYNCACKPCQTMAQARGHVTGEPIGGASAVRQ